MKKIIRKGLSLTIMIIFLLTLLPVNLMAVDIDKPGATITNIYDNFQRTEKKIFIEDNAISGWQNKALSLFVEGEFRNVSSFQDFGDIVQANINKDWNIIRVRVSNAGGLGNRDYFSINENDIPVVQGVATPIIETDEYIILNGPNNLINLLDDSIYSIRVGNIKAVAHVIIGKTNQVELRPQGSSKFQPGWNNIEINRKEMSINGAVDGVSTNYNLLNKFIYRNAVRVVGTIDLTGLEMFPTVGDPSSEVEFKRGDQQFAQAYDVYFIENLNDPNLYTATNLAKNIKLSPDNKVLTISVPTVAPGPYHLVFTNSNSRTVGINARYVHPNTFTVLGVTPQPTITSIQPNSTPAQTETDVNIRGYNFAKHNIHGLVLDKSPDKDDIQGLGTQVLNIKYGSGKFTIGGVAHDVYVERKIEVFIADQLIINDFHFDPNNLNVLNTIIVRTNQFPLTQIRVDDVRIRMETKITGGFEGTIIKNVIRSNGFTYLPSTEVPVVSSITPHIVPIEEVGLNYYIHSNLNEIQLAIKGEKFLVTRYTDGSRVYLRYPKIIIGGTEINTSEAISPWLLSFEVLKDGVRVEGTQNNQLGNTILIKLKAGATGIPILNKDSDEVIIINPIRNSTQYADPYHFAEKIEFLLINNNDFPVIQEVRPNLVAVEGGEEIVVIGSNLRTGAKLYLDGKLVPNIQISPDNTRIIFKSPAGRAGVTLLQVQNPEPGAGIASFPFTYTTTYTEPKLISITPPFGSKETSVTAKGQAFLRTDPTVAISGDIDELDEYLIYRLIGSRIQMGGHDINKYNKVANKIQLQSFAVGNIFVNFNSEVRLGESYDSTFLYDEITKKFYRIIRDVKNHFFIDDGIGNIYSIQYVNGGYNAVLGGQVFPISQNPGAVTFQGKTLRAYTPYQIDSNKITGNRVRFIDSNTLIFDVPNLAQTPWTGDGLYDVTVMNPDTKRSTLPKAFRYYSNPVRVPVVIDVIPDQGPEIGGNLVRLISPHKIPVEYQETGFVDSAGLKTRVFIGNQESKNVIVSPNLKELTFQVPQYTESIRDKGSDRITVPIVLVNPDGGSFSITYNKPIPNNLTELNKTIYGYTYVVPSSNPRITDIVPKEGSANGGYIVEIFGNDFRDFKVNRVGDEEIIERANLQSKRTSQYNSTYKYLDDRLLPEVYFGNRRAEIMEFSSGYLQLIIPPGNATVNVFVVNNDSGISNVVPFKYISSNPIIKNVTPAIGNKAGGEKVEIQGTGFDLGEINKLNKNSEIISSKLMLVKVGSRTNENLPREHENSGLIRSGRATVNLDGGLEVKYNAEDGILDISVRDYGKNYQHSYIWNANQKVFISSKDLQTSVEETFLYEELILVKIVDNRLFVDAGYAPAVEFRNSGHLIATMPGYYTIGQVPLSIINPDAGKATAQFEFKNPDSKPKITNITRDGHSPQQMNIEGNTYRILRLNYAGNSIVSVLGEDFRENARIQVSNLFTIQPGNIKYILPNKLTFTMPVVNESELGKLHRLVLINEDGGVASSDNLNPPIYIQFTKGETFPQISNLTPKIGPSAGGTVVRIEGKDFRSRMDGYTDPLAVYFGEIQVPSNNVEVVDYKTINVISPINAPGKRNIRVENPDGEISTPSGDFTYISNPRIHAVLNANDPTESTRLSKISIEGGQEIKLKGVGFMDGAKVVFVPETAEIAQDAGNVIYRVKNQEDEIHGQTYSSNVIAYHELKSGVDGSEVRFIDSETLTVKTPAGKLDTKGIIVINPDKGASDPYDDIIYDLPELDAPLNVTAEIVRDRYNNTDRFIKVNWSKVNNAHQYEIYVVKDGQREFIGTTELTSYIYEDLEPRTTYKFVVTAVGNFGESPPSAISNELRTGRTVGPPDEDGGIHEHTEMKKIGNIAQVSIGTSDFSNRVIQIDLTRGSLAGSKEVIISMPASVISSNRAQNIEIIGGDFSMRFNPSAFKTSRVEDNRNQNDAGVRFKIAPDLNNSGVYGGNTLSNVYALEADFFTGRDSSKIDQLVGRVDLIMDIDVQKASMRRLENISMHRYNEHTNSWQPMGWESLMGNSSAKSIQQLGRYTIIGSRR